LGGVTGPTSGAVDVQAVGQAGIPLGATSVVLNVTVDHPTASGYLTVWPTGADRPDASNVNFEAGQTVPNLVIAKIGGDGKISYFNNSGRVQVIMDVLGYTGTGNDPEFTPLVPARVLDTRTGVGAPAGRVAGGGTFDLQVLDRGGVPATGVGAVVLNLTATDPETSGYLTAFPDDAALPTASNVNFVGGQTVANLVIVPVGATGGVNIYNFGGAAHVVADVLGWYTSPTAWLRSAPVPSLCDSQAGNLVNGELPPSLLAHDPNAPIPASVTLLGTPPPAQGQLNSRAVTVATILCVYPSVSYPQGYQSLVVWDDQHQLVGAVTVYDYPTRVAPDGDGFVVDWISCTPDIVACIPDVKHTGRLVLTDGLHLQESTAGVPVVTCPRFAFNDHGDYADQVTVTGIDCPAATAVIVDIGAQHAPWSDPPNAVIDGFTCQFRQLPGTPGDAGQYGRYDCARSGATLAFEFYSGE
jgi:hypothetical protein